MGLFSAIAGVVSGGLSAVGSIFGSKSKKKAAQAQARAIASLEGLDVSELRDLYAAADLETYRRSLAAQRELDPNFAALRQEGAASILETLAADREFAAQYTPALQRALASLELDEERRQRIADLLVRRAEQDISEGATLPAEYQAELVRMGLAKAGASGFAPEGRGATGVTVRQLTGAAGLALQQQRLRQALEQLNAAAQLRTQAARTAQSLLGPDAAIRQSWAARAGEAARLGQGALPTVGMPGSLATQLSVQNTMFRNMQRLAAADAEARKALASGELFGSILGGLGGVISSLPSLWGQTKPGR